MSLTGKIRKADWLNEFRAVVIAGIVLIPALVLAEIVMLVLGGGDVVAELHTSPAGQEEFTAGGQVMEHLSTEVAIGDPTTAQVLWYLGTRLPSFAVLLTALVMMLRLLNRARRGNPFSRETVRHLRRLAGVLIVGGPLASLAESVATVGLSETLPGNVSGSWDVPVAWLFAGFGAMAIAQIVARGCAMREELDEVI
jgi:hypothetical protein